INTNCQSFTWVENVVTITFSERSFPDGRISDKKDLECKIVIDHF
ncbi:hypothetical protein LCGC14_3138240, partial [marine sediment metagenome]